MQKAKLLANCFCSSSMADNKLDTRRVDLVSTAKQRQLLAVHLTCQKAHLTLFKRQVLTVRRVTDTESDPL